MGKLTEAVEQQNLGEVNRLLAGEYRNSPLINAADSKDWTALQLAARYGHIGIIQALLQAGAQVDQADKKGQPPLLLAAKNGHVEVVKLLLAAKADVEVKFSNYETPLLGAAENGHAEVVKLLLAAKADVDAEDAYGETPLFLAAEKSHVEVVKLLLAAKADVEECNEDRETPLFRAAANGHVEVVRLLLAAKADVEAKDYTDYRYSGKTPLFMAAANGHVEVVKLLLMAKADVEVKISNGETPLLGAAVRGHVEVVRLLLAAKANIEAKDQHGNTLLFIAVCNNHKKAVELLLSAGANPQLKTPKGTALEIAEAKGHAEIAALIKQHLAKPVANTPLVNSINWEQWMASMNGTTPAFKAFNLAHPTETQTDSIQSIKVDSALINETVPDLEPLPIPLPPKAKTLPIQTSDSEQWMASIDGTIPAFKAFNLANPHLAKTDTSSSGVTANPTPDVVLQSAPKVSPVMPVAFSPSTPLPTLSASWQIPSEDVERGAKIGQGGFGCVYQATWQFNTVAVKQLWTVLTDEEQKAFKQEVQTMAELHFPQLIQFYGYTVEPYSIVMEYMPKGDLTQVLQNPTEALPWDLRETIALDIAKGLAFLHTKNILHRDLKSMNVLLDQHYRAKLTDFGLAKVKHKSSQTQSQALVGTSAWMAPELLNFEETVTYSIKSDLYSYGMVVWELASRKLPFEKAPNPMAICFWTVQGKRETIPAETPQKLAHLIKCCWQQNPQQRPSAPAAIAHLEGKKMLGP